MSANQEFLWAPDLKADLKQANAHFQAFPDTIKEKGIMAFARHPPGGDDSLMIQLWDRYSPGWRKAATTRVFEPVKNAELAAEIKRMNQARTLDPEEIDFDPRDADSIAIHRLVSKRRGSWWQLAADLKDEGETDDI
jgi:hypothetical protein